MKKQLASLLIVLLTSLGCQKETINGQVDGCVGATFYYLDNQSSRSFLIEFMSPKLNQQLDSATVIHSQQRVLIGQDASFGSSPHPADTFSRFALVNRVDEQKSVIYQQNPVQTALWVKRKHKPTDPDYGCQEVDYTLTIIDELLK